MTRRLVAVGISLLIGVEAPAECPETKLTASDAAAGDSFGRSVSLSGDVALVGAFGDDDAAKNSGSVYVYRFDGRKWTEEAELKASDAAVGDIFGSSVSLSGPVALIGASSDDDAGASAGAAYVYRFDGSNWVEEQKLIASDTAAGDRFAWAVSVSGAVAVVTALRDDDAGDDSGAAYVYRFDGSSWVEEQKLTASDAAAGDHFGQSVSVNSEVAVVGASRNDGASMESGSAYVYRFDGSSWVEEQKLTSSDGAQGDSFGDASSVCGALALIGASRDDDAGTSSGSAYVYRFDGTAWLEEQKLIASDGTAFDVFGNTVSVSGDLALVGAFGDDLCTGSAYAYRFDGSAWLEEQKLTASDAAGDDEFAWSVSLSGQVAVVGAQDNDDAGVSSGSAYIFSFNCPPPNPPGPCCFSSGACAQLSEPACAASGGMFQAEGGSCLQVACPEPVGACCFPDGTCAALAEEFCTSLNAAYQGDFTACMSADCPQPTGACCFLDGGCAELTEADCQVRGEDYVGNFTTCVTADCPRPTGACCSADGSCAEIPEAECVAGNGAYEGDSTRCATTDCPCVADVGGNGIVGVRDLILIILDWGCVAPPDCEGDINGDGIVDLGDLMLVIMSWGPCD